VIKVRRRPTPELDLPPGYQHGYWPYPNVVTHTVNGRIQSVTPMTDRQLQLMEQLRELDRQIEWVLGWNVIEGDHDL
jgi:hypothetical protein